MTGDKLLDMLIKHEGMVLKPYIDVVGKLTIGVGRNLDDNGVTREEAIFMLTNDVARTKKELSQFNWFNALDKVRQDAIINMVFNLGLPAFLKFKKTIKALEEKDFERASVEMLDSRWAAQVGNRAKELSYMIKTGKYPENS